MKTMALTAAAVLGLAGTASAMPTFITTLGNTLYRTTNGVTSQFTLSDDITSLEVMGDGTIYGASRTDDDNDGFFELYRLDDAEGTPSLTLMGDFLANNTPSLLMSGGTLYGFQHTPGGSDNSDLVTIDAVGGTQASVGTIGTRVNSSGFDHDLGEAWGMNRGSDVNSMLHSVDLGTPGSSPVGSTGVQTFNAGGDFWNGTLYRAFENGDTLRLATIDTGSGAQTPFLTLAMGVSNTGVGTTDVGLVIIPTPGTGAIIGLAGLAALRRRR